MSAAIEGLRLEPVVSSRGRDFLETYGALASEFGPRGELERREVVARWVEGSLAAAEPYLHTYRLLALRDPRGALVGARDVHLVVDRSRRVVVAYLAHALVLPPFRRRGAGALLRAAPLTLARRAAHDGGLGDRADILLAAEMEPPADDDPASHVRLVAYGREGFSAIAPATFPYYQPDFTDPWSRRAPPRPLRLLAVVRHVGHEGAPVIEAQLARAFVQHLHAVFATHVARSELRPLAERALAVTDAATTLPLVPLPRSLDDHATFQALRPVPA